MTETRNPGRTHQVGRPPLKQRRIASDMRRLIVSGAIGASGRLPTRAELCAKYEASAATVQNALNHLANEGFLVAKGTLGTFVAERPPHLTRYALVAAQHRGEKGYPRFWAAIENESLRLEQELGIDLELWHGIDEHTDNEDFHRLCGDVTNHRLAGLIFLHAPFQYEHTPLRDEPGIARVALMPPDSRYGIHSIGVDYNSLFERAVACLAQQGRKRLAILMRPHIPEGWMTRLQHLLNQHQMRMEPYWLQLATHDSEMAVGNIMQLLMHAGQKERPDGLIIADDNLVEAASAGVVRAGVRVPEDLTVVAHCNYPWPTASVLPVKRLGYDARQVLLKCIESIDAQKRGESPGAPVEMPALFEEEVGR